MYSPIPGCPKKGKRQILKNLQKSGSHLYTYAGNFYSPIRISRNVMIESRDFFLFGPDLFKEKIRRIQGNIPVFFITFHTKLAKVWWSSAVRVTSLNRAIRLALFWSPWSGIRGPHSPTYRRVWAHTQSPLVHWHHFIFFLPFSHFSLHPLDPKHKTLNPKS